MKSPKELSIDKKILEQLNGASASYKVAQTLMEDPEVQEMQEYANTVSIVRIGYNDHGPVHMRTVTRNAVIMMNLLHEAGKKTSLETENAGTLDDSFSAIILASFTRSRHVHGTSGSRTVQHDARNADHRTHAHESIS